jgi:hypothetical protein
MSNLKKGRMVKDSTFKKEGKGKEKENANLVEYLKQKLLILKKEI